jgi:hypothetical protein
VDQVEGVENYDFSDIVSSHDEYPARMDEIFTRLRFHW